MMQEFADEKFEWVGIEKERGQVKKYKTRTYWQDVIHQMVTNKVALLSLCVIILIVLFALLIPVFSPYSYKDVDMANAYSTPGFPHIFGTDELGRDILTRCAVGTRISLYIALIAVILDMGIGITYGLISGYFGGTVDLVMQRIVEIINGIPTMVIVTLLLMVVKPGIISITIAMGITGWTNMSRIVRAQVLKQKSLEYVLAARTLGTPNWVIILYETLMFFCKMPGNTVFSGICNTKSTRIYYQFTTFARTNL